VYDIIVPDADHIRIEKGLGLLMKLDHSLIPNLKNLAPHWTQLSYDPGNVYSVMKDTGLTGFTMRTDKIKANLRTWKDFFDFLPTAKGVNVNFIESPAEVIGVALNALGFSMNTESQSELNAARDLLLKVRPHVNTINEVYVDDFISGSIDLSITYSGDGLRIRKARKAQNDIRVARTGRPVGDLDRQLGHLGICPRPDRGPRLDQLHARARRERPRDGVRPVRGRERPPPTRRSAPRRGTRWSCSRPGS